MITHFWMVCRTPTHAGSETKPQKRFATREQARTIASQMAAQEGVPFTLLEAVETIQPRPDTPRLL